MNNINIFPIIFDSGKKENIRFQISESNYPKLLTLISFWSFDAFGEQFCSSIYFERI